MPARLSPSPPVPPALSSLQAMSLTEMSRPVQETHLLQSTLPCMTDMPDPRNLRQAAFSASQRALPSLQTRQFNEPGYTAHRPIPNVGFHPVHHRQESSAAPLGRTSPHSRQPPSFSPSSLSPLEYHVETGGGQRSEAGSSSPRPVIKRDESEEVSYFKTTLPSPPGKNISPTATTFGNPNVTHQEALHGTATRGDISRQMGISSLINSNEPSSSATYDIIIRQQPIAARACGFGDRDRRVIDPPAILQMLVRDPGATPAELNTKMRYPFSVIHCELWNAELDQEETAMPEIGDRPPQRRLMGTVVASPFVGRDEFGVEGCFFPFPDLSCRTTGKYRLKFVLLVLNPANMKMGDSLPFMATVLSEAFEVYPAKTFPGMVPSTELTKRLKEQGCLISVKKGHQKLAMSTEGRPSEENEDEDNDAEDAEGSAAGREKRQKT